MKAAKFTLFGRATAFCPSAAVMLTMLLLMVAATIARAQTTVFVPGNASGCFGNPPNGCTPLVAALAVSGTATITVTYVSGTVDPGSGIDAGPTGQPWDQGPNQTPLQEAAGVSSGIIDNLGALIGVFVPKSRVNDSRGFQAIDGTKAPGAGWHQALFSPLYRQEPHL